jgi:hypothetical protein
MRVTSEEKICGVTTLIFLNKFNWNLVDLHSIAQIKKILNIILFRKYLYTVCNFGQFQTGGQLIEFHLTFSVDQNFLLNLVLDRNFFFLFFVNWSNFTWSFQLVESSNNGIFAFKKFRSTAKFCKLFFGSWSKVLIIVF